MTSCHTGKQQPESGCQTAAPIAAIGSHALSSLTQFLFVYVFFVVLSVLRVSVFCTIFPICWYIFKDQIYHGEMLNSTGCKPVLLARLEFPPYCMKVISERHILVAGGGGSARTGVPNCVNIYELLYDPVTNSEI